MLAAESDTREPDGNMKGKTTGKAAPEGIDAFINAVENAWRKEFEDADARNVSLFTRMLILSRMETGFWTSALGGSQRNAAEYYVLAILYALGPQTPGALNIAQMQTSGGLTKTLVRLEKAGLICRKPVIGDRRSFEAQLTPAGRKVAKGMMSRLREAMREKVEQLPESKLMRANQVLDELIRLFVD